MKRQKLQEDLNRNFGVEKQNSWNEKFTRGTQQQIEFAGKSIEII